MQPTTTESAALLANVAREGWWFEAKEDIVRGFLRGHVDDTSSVLILGSGNGATTRRLRQLAPRCEITGIDIDPAAVALCRERDAAGTYRRVDFEAGDLTLQDLTPDARPFDLMIALDVVEHLEDDRAALRRLTSWLRPGGILAVNVPAHPWLFSDHDRALGHFRRYRPRDIDSRLREAGLEIVHTTPLFATSLVLLTVWRLLIQRFLPTDSSTSDVARGMPRPIDRMLYGIARIEGIVAKYRLPFGSSHLVLGRASDV